ncbi:hypothetical protein P692DRAFT_20882179 [Suillus brevipes Sb2]|nr:hypothetical protein P692DRAFT_20882179 [Suillus brevipes Sb2]
MDDCPTSRSRYPNGPTSAIVNQPNYLEFTCAMCWSIVSPSAMLYTPSPSITFSSRTCGWKAYSARVVARRPRPQLLPPVILTPTIVINVDFFCSLLLFTGFHIYSVSQLHGAPYFWGRAGTYLEVTVMFVTFGVGDDYYIDVTQRFVCTPQTQFHSIAHLTLLHIIFLLLENEESMIIAKPARVIYCFPSIIVQGCLGNLIDSKRMPIVSASTYICVAEEQYQQK